MCQFNRVIRLAALATFTVLVLGGCTFARYTPPTNFRGCTPEKTIFFSRYVDHNKAVEICKVDGGYRYTTGPIHNPTVSIIKSYPDVQRTPLRYGYGFKVRNLDYEYELTQDVYWNYAVVVSHHYSAHAARIISREALDTSKNGFVNNNKQLPE